MHTSQMNQDEELWEAEDWYPPLCPPKILKEELLRDEDFTEVDQKARAAPTSLKESYDELVAHLTNCLNSDLHKLRSIFVWMGANKVGTQEETESCENNHSPRYYLKKACKNSNFIDKLFAKMCRCARIPCILVSGKTKSISYDPGDDDIKGRNTWAVVFVASSWRFVFPHWAFVKLSGYQNQNWMLVEDCGKAVRKRFPTREGKLVSALDEFYFLTDPDVMKHKCHPNDKEKQLLTEPWKKEKFFAAPFFYASYFSSGWHLVSPLTCLIKARSGCCSIDLLSPGANSKLKYELYFDEGRSQIIFPQEIQTDRYVIIMKQSSQTVSVIVRLPETGTYKLKLTGVHQGKTYGLAQFRIDCDYVAVEAHPFPPYPKDGYGFVEDSSSLLEPSITEGIVPVKSGEDVSISFNVQEDVNISARLVHSTRTPEDLKSYVTVSRRTTNTTVTARLPEDDSTPEYSLEVDVINTVAERKSGKERNYRAKNPSTYNRALNYLLTSDTTLTEEIRDKTKKLPSVKRPACLNENAKELQYQQNRQFFQDACVAVTKDDAVLLAEAASRVKMAGIEDPVLDQKIRTKETKYQRMQEEMLDAARERNLDRLNRAITACMSVNLQYKADVEYAKNVLLELRKEEDAKKILLEISELQESKRNVTLLTDENLAKMLKPPVDVINVLFATFILLGKRETNVDTWHKIWAKLKKTNGYQLFARLSSLDDSVLTQEQVDLAQEKLQQCTGSLGNDKVYKALYSWCSDRIKSYQLREKLTRINLPVELSDIHGQEERSSPVYMTKKQLLF